MTVREAAGCLKASAVELQTLLPKPPMLEEHLGRLVDMLEDLRSEEPEFRLVVMGEFSSGKSSLVNALVQREVLKVAATIETAHVSILTYGEKEQAEFCLRDGRSYTVGLAEGLDTLAKQGQKSDLLALLVSVRLALDAEALREMRLVDTPGLATVLQEHEQLTQDLLSRSNCVLWVFDANQAGTGTERDYLARLKGRCILGLLNKADDLDDAEIGDVVDAVRSISPDLLDVLPVSAYEAMEALKAGDTDRLVRSGVPAVRAYLTDHVDVLQRMSLDVAHQSRLRDATCELYGLVIGESARLDGILANWQDVLAVLSRRREDLLGRLQADLDRHNRQFFADRRARFSERIQDARHGDEIRAQVTVILGAEALAQHGEDLQTRAVTAFQEEWSATLTQLQLVSFSCMAHRPGADLDDQREGEGSVVQLLAFTGGGALSGTVGGAALALIAHLSLAILPLTAGLGAVGAAGAYAINRVIRSHEQHSLRSRAEGAFGQDCDATMLNFDRAIRDQLMPVVERENAKAEQRVETEFCDALLAGIPVSGAQAKLEGLRAAADTIRLTAAARQIELA